MPSRAQARGSARHRRVHPLIVALCCVAWLASCSSDAPRESLTPARGALMLQDVSFHRVSFPEPVRVGRGEGAVLHDEAVEIRVRVPPFLETDVSPFLYVGDLEVRASMILREGASFILAYDVFDASALSENGCIEVTTQHRVPGQGPPEGCAFHYDSGKVVDSAPLERPPLDPASLGAPPGDDSEPTAPPAEPASSGPTDYSGVWYELFDPRGSPLGDEPLQPGDTLGIAVHEVKSRDQVQIRVVDDLDNEWAYGRFSADAQGEIPQTVLWYNTGVIGTTDKEISSTPALSFETFAQAYDYWSAHGATIQILSPDGAILHESPLDIAPSRTTPLLYPSNESGVLMNAMNAERPSIDVTGTGFPAGSTVYLYLVESRDAWSPGDVLFDVTGLGDASGVEVVTLAPGQTSFTTSIWCCGRAIPGRYDIVAHVEASPLSELPRYPRVVAGDMISFGLDSALVLYSAASSHISIDIAGRPLSDAVSSTWFEFADVFERNETVWGAVDPTDFPVSHPGGQYAAYYVVPHQPAIYWDWPSPALVDVSGPGGTSQIEVAQVKYSCINVTRTAIWPSADPPGMTSDYDVIVEFGATPAQSSQSYQTDATYDEGVDFIDRYGAVGFRIVRDPSVSWAPFGIGSDSYYSDTFSGNNPAFSMTSLGFPLVRDWFSIRYPAQWTGQGAPLPTGSSRYPVVLFLHGNHAVCTTGWACDHSCPPQSRIASHRGYGYLQDMLARHGMIAISVDAFDINCNTSLYEYEARGTLILEHLNRIRDWDQNGTDPFGGAFQGRIDMSRVVLVGHSRGGEGAVAASVLNAQPAYQHAIDGVLAVAPTDQDAVPWDITGAPYFLLMGAADGDVSNFQGLRTYDRAYPAAAISQHEKTLAWVYGANHNYFNTVWTPGSGDPFASDDGAAFSPRITGAEQRQITASTLGAYVMSHIAGLQGYREVFTGRLPFAAMRNDMTHWSYQDASRRTLDDFQDASATVNTLGGAVTLSGLAQASQSPTALGFHQTTVMTLGWNSATATYTSAIPTAQNDVSAYTHLSFRISQIAPDPLNPPGGAQGVIVRLSDTASSYRTSETRGFTPIPYPYQRGSSYAHAMKTVRIPLRAFTLNNSGVDLTDIATVSIEFDSASTGRIAIDDLAFTQ